MKLGTFFPRILTLNGPPQAWTPFQRRLHAQFNLREVSIVGRLAGRETVKAALPGEIDFTRGRRKVTSWCRDCHGKFSYRLNHATQKRMAWRDFTLCGECARKRTCRACGQRFRLRPRASAKTIYCPSCGPKARSRAWWEKQRQNPKVK